MLVPVTAQPPASPGDSPYGPGTSPPFAGEPYQPYAAPAYQAGGYDPRGYPQPGYAAPGYPPPGGYGGYNLQATEKNAWGVAALVLAIAGVTLVPGIGSILGVVFGHLGLKAAKEGRADNRGVALAGVIVGYVGLALTLVIVILVVVVLAAVSSDPHYWYAPAASLVA
jgi:hypothetical protein